MKNSIFITFFLITLSSCSNPQEITWQDLSKVKFVDKDLIESNNAFSYPVFSESVKALDGKMIKLSGYFLHIYPSRNIYMLSKGPLSSCFFCGVGGPETTVELQFNARQKIKTDDIVSVTGRLQLNSEDNEHFIYILTECKVTLID